MNWYKLASLIDNVQVARFSGNEIVLIIGGKRYAYSGVAGPVINETIGRLKRHPNKHEAGQQVNAIIRSLHKHIVI